MKFNINKTTLVLLLLIGISYTGLSQIDCPDFPQQTKFSRATLIKTQTPTDPNKEDGIWLGQGTIGGIPSYIPSNKPTWAIAIAHAWNYHRNIINRVEYPHIGYYLATVRQESDLRCVETTIWDDASKVDQLYTTSNSTWRASAKITQNNNGCFQIESTPGFFLLSQSYPTRFGTENNNGSLFNGSNNFETSALSKTYYDIYTPFMYNYYKEGFPIYETIDLTPDKFAYDKTIASGYNGGAPSFSSNKPFFLNGKTNSCWNNLTSTTAGYPSKIGQFTTLLENSVQETGNCLPDGTFGEYYNENIKWSDISSYLDIIGELYHEFDMVNVVKPQVLTLWDSIAGNSTNTIPFKEIGPIIDEMILIFPAEYPKYVNGTPNGINGCIGDTIPYGNIEVQSGNLITKKNEPVSLRIVVNSKDSSTLRYQWFTKSDTATILSTQKEFTFTPKTTGITTIQAKTCDTNGCYLVNCANRNSCGVEITVEENSSCQLNSLNSNYTITSNKNSIDYNDTITLFVNNPQKDIGYIFSTRNGGILDTVFTQSNNDFSFDYIRKPNAVLDFDGIDDVVKFSNPINGLSNFTIELSALTTRVTNDANAIIQCYKDIQGGYSNLFELYLYKGEVYVTIPTNPTFTDITTGYTMPLNEFVHFIIVKQNSTLNIYANGKQIFTYSQSFSLSEVLQIGRWKTFTNRGLKGQIDNLSIYNKAFSIHPNIGSNQINSSDGLVARYDFNQGIANGDNSSITSLTDNTGNNHNGTIKDFNLVGNSSNFINQTTLDTIFVTAIDTVNNCKLLIYSKEIQKEECSINDNVQVSVNNDSIPLGQKLVLTFNTTRDNATYYVYNSSEILDSIKADGNISLTISKSDTFNIFSKTNNTPCYDTLTYQFATTAYCGLDSSAIISSFDESNYSNNDSLDIKISNISNAERVEVLKNNNIIHTTTSNINLTYPTSLSDKWELKLLNNYCSQSVNTHTVSVITTCSSLLPKDSIIAGQPKTICEDSYKLEGTIKTQYDSLRWSPTNKISNQNLISEVSNLVPGINNIILSVYYDGCSTSDTLVLNYNANTFECYPIEVFNVVTPNDDDIHDYFKIKNIDKYNIEYLKIFDKRGTIVFETNQNNQLFTGVGNKFNKNELAEGTYYYKFKVKEVQEEFSGHLLLKR